MSDQSQSCPKCQSLYGYKDGNLWICPECAFEWPLESEALEVVEAKGVKYKDANGVELNQGDSVRVIKDLKVGGETIKSGTKVKSIRLLEEPINGHDISCRIEGHGSLYLKCSVVRKDS